MSNETFSAADIRIVMAVIKNVKTIDVNWEDVAADGSFSTGKYARDSWAAFRKKHVGQDASTKRKRDDDAEDGEQAQETPKKARGGKKAAKGAKGAKGKAGTQMEGDDDANEQTPVKTEEDSLEN